MYIETVVVVSVSTPEPKLEQFIWALDWKACSAACFSKRPCKVFGYW